MDTDENRTHGAESAINDELAAAVPDDMGNAPINPGDIPLNYDLQTFNSLVASNTALLTEQSSQAAMIAALESARGDLREENTRVWSEIVKVQDAMREQKKAGEAAVSEQRERASYYRELSVELQRKLDRQAGYLDRVLDQEDGYDAPKTVTSPAPAPAVGPRLDDIPRATRGRRTDGESTWAIAAQSATLHSHQSGRPRRN